MIKLLLIFPCIGIVVLIIFLVIHDHYTDKIIEIIQKNKGQEDE